MHVLSMQLLKLVNEEMAGGVEAKVGGVPHEQGVGLSAWCLLGRLASSRGPLWTAQSPFCPWGGAERGWFSRSHSPHATCRSQLGPLPIKRRKSLSMFLLSPSDLPIKRVQRMCV